MRSHYLPLGCNQEVRLVRHSYSTLKCLAIPHHSARRVFLRLIWVICTELVTQRLLLASFAMTISQQMEELVRIPATLLTLPLCSWGLHVPRPVGVSRLAVRLLRLLLLLLLLRLPSLLRSYVPSSCKPQDVLIPTLPRSPTTV
jgi:hypothetical protein